MHFELMTPRIYELGGRLPSDIRKFADMAACPDAYLPEDWKDPKSILKVLLGAEQCTIRMWSEVCYITIGKDPRTYDLAQRIVTEEVEHEASSWSCFMGGHRVIFDADSLERDHAPRNKPV